MNQFQAILVGSVLGLAGTAPTLFLFELALKDRRRVSVAAGLAGIMVSFVFFTCALLAVRVAAPDRVLVFGVSVVASFLLAWVVEAWRAWRDAQRGIGPRERNHGESSG